MSNNAQYGVALYCNNQQDIILQKINTSNQTMVDSYHKRQRKQKYDTKYDNPDNFYAWRY